MLKIKKVAAVVTLAATIGLTGAAAANADVQYPVQGGKWEYGFWDAYARSYYDHGTRCHGSTAQNDWGTSRSIDTAAGHRAAAEVFGTIFTHNKYYYRVC
ncbi:lactococcin 972 family bacteriocin [Tersicoccus sp. MR15.9]|uniref:lactococcin 972 family bacteriocin n=1 Tax=Tersicoccus mangrovi TaxID=3121635 RepID=UPI002FE5D83E